MSFFERNCEPAILKQIKALIFDFDGVFTDNTVQVHQDGSESVRCWRGDGLGLSRLQKLGIKLLIVSTEANPIVSVRARKLKIECQQSVENKAKAVETWAESCDIPLSQIGFIGNDINDIPVLRKVGFPIGVADPHQDILPFISYQTRKRGGYGAVREICDLVADAYSLVKATE